MGDDWGDEKPGIEAQPLELDERHEPGTELPEREPGQLFGVDIADVANALAAPAIRAVVQKAITDAVKDAVEAEVDEALDPSAIEELQAQAATAARRAVAAAMDALDEEPADAVLRLGRRVRARIPGEELSPPRRRSAHRVGCRLVELPRGNDPPRCALAGVGAPSPRPDNRHECLVP